MVNANLIIQNPTLMTPEIFDHSTGLRALFIDRENISSLPQNWTQNSCGFYILFSWIRPDNTFDAFVGKVIKGFAGMLTEHDETKYYWNTAILIKMDSGFSINQSAYLEGRLREILDADDAVTLRNVRPPWDYEPSQKELPALLSAIEFALKVISVKGYARDAMADKAELVSEAIRNSMDPSQSNVTSIASLPSRPQRPVFTAPVNKVSTIGKKTLDFKPEASEQEIFVSLKEWRTLRASNENVPAYVIMNNRTLQDIAAIQPATKDDLGSIQGMGKKRLDLYGDEILSVISSRKSLIA